MTELESLNAAIAALDRAWGPLYDAADAADPGTPEGAALEDAEDTIWGSLKELKRLRRRMAG